MSSGLAWTGENLTEETDIEDICSRDTAKIETTETLTNSENSEHPNNSENSKSWEEVVEECWDCEECGPAIQYKMIQDCAECGAGISEEELRQTLIGLDVVGLFPAMLSQNTGKIIRRMVMKSSMEIKGMNWKHAARYIVMNKELTGDTSNI